MKEVVFIDVLIFENFFMNYLLLYIVNRFCKCKAKWWRISAGSLFGAFYVLILFFPSLNIFYSAGIKFIVSLIMIVIAFSPYRLRDFLRIVILFYIIAFIIGGGLFAYFYISNQNVDVFKGAFLFDVSPWHLIIGSSVLIILIKLGFDYFENYYSFESKGVDLQIFMENRSCEIRGLIDTGNSLKDPLTNQPIIVVYIQSIINIFPEDLKSLIQKYGVYDLSGKLLNSSIKQRIRVIPYKALGIEDGLLTGVRVDLVIARSKNKTNVLKEVIIALYEKPLSIRGDYDALVFPEILK